MTVLLLSAWGLFGWQAARRWRLMRIGPNENRADNIGERLARTWRFGILQERMTRYFTAGIAHKAIFAGFIILLLRSLILFARGFTGVLPADQHDLFGWWLFDHGTVLGNFYSFIKDIVAVAVMIGAAVFLYYRLIAKLDRMSLSGEGILILAIIETMMAADILYDAAAGAYYAGASSPTWTWHEPVASIFAMALYGMSPGALKVLAHLGFWTHVFLVLAFLNLLPISKHFHIITAIPNIFTQSLAPRGRLPMLADIEGKLERGETLGLNCIDQLSWKGILDLYTCTECGRCTDQCPAHNTGKLLSPKQLTLDLRNYLYANEKKLVNKEPIAQAIGVSGEAVTSETTPESGNGHTPISVADDLVPQFIKPETLWACTTCGACETECPVFITYVDKIVDMRRHLVMEKSEFPAELQNAFRGLESGGNPWSFPATDRAGWSDGLDAPFIRDKPDAEVLFWVGCSASYDDRARRIARAMANLLKAANVNFAILGEEETCTGDPARRAGNEFLFQMLAQTNVETLNRYNPRTIVTTCPHCFNTLLNEYPDFGGKFNVIHHTTFLSQLVRDGRLKPTNRVDAKVAYHDSCYLGRYNEVYEAPREALRSIPGLTVLEPRETRDRGMCCGAGGAQMFKEEEHAREGAVGERVNERRTLQLLETKPDMVASACPFCQRMLIDGLAGKSREDVGQFDIAELLWKAVEKQEPSSVGHRSSS